MTTLWKLLFLLSFSATAVFAGLACDLDSTRPQKPDEKTEKADRASRVEKADQHTRYGDMAYLKGRITDRDGRAVAGADVKARIADCDCKKDCPGVVGCPCCPDAVTKTNSRGDYNLILKPGEYDVRIFRDGIEKTSHDVKVEKGKTREYDAKVKENY